jgi:hypothetical protein
MQGDGTVIREDIHNETFATRITAILQDSGALTSQWEVDTVKAHYEIEVQTVGETQALAHARAGVGGHAGAGNQAFALLGNAVESADFKTQSFGALSGRPHKNWLAEHGALQAANDMAWRAAA